MYFNSIIITKSVCSSLENVFYQFFKCDVWRKPVADWIRSFPSRTFGFGPLSFGNWRNVSRNRNRTSGLLSTFRKSGFPIFGDNHQYLILLLHFSSGLVKIGSQSKLPVPYVSQHHLVMHFLFIFHNSSVISFPY